MRFTAFLLLTLWPALSHAICVPLNASDGMMGTVVCYSESEASAPIQSPSETSLSSFPFSGANVQITGPTITSSTGITFVSSQSSAPSISASTNWSLQPTFVTLPQITMPEAPAVSTPKIIQMPQNNIPAIDHSALDSARAAAGASAMIFWSAQQSAFKVARQDLESNQKAIEDWRKTNADQLEVQIHSEFTKIDQALEQSTNAAESKPEGAVSETGLLRPELIPNSEMRILSEKLDLKSDITTEEGRSVRKTINRAFALADAQPNRQRDETLKTAVVMSVGADLAYSAGQREEAQRLIRAAGITLDIAIGFVPIASSINDATQIVFGLMTGRDYNGNVMTAADYSLRAAGIVIGLLPAGAASFKFGAVVINRASLVTAKLIRRLPIGKIDEMARAAGIILANPVGGVGKGIAAIIRYRRIFPDSERFQAMMSALKPYNYVLTKAGRGLTKHPEALGFDSPEALRKALRTNAALNEAAEKIVEKMLTEGKRVEDFMRTIGSNVIDYALPNGVGVRIKADSFEFITFVQGVL